MLQNFDIVHSFFFSIEMGAELAHSHPMAITIGRNRKLTVFIGDIKIRGSNNAAGFWILKNIFSHPPSGNIGDGIFDSVEID